VSLPEKILFCGLGGAGQRHLRIFHELLPETTKFVAFRSTSSTPLLNADFTVDTSDTLESKYGVEMMSSLEDGLASSPDLVVISSPAAMHLDTAMAALESGCDIFMEKPWATTTENFSQFRQGVIKKGVKFHISFQRRYHPLIRMAKSLLDSGELGQPLTGYFEVFSDFRQWHPYEDWRRLYAARKSLGGGVLLTEIHETDLACWFFGKPRKVYCQGGTWSGEDIDVEDFAQLIVGFESSSVMINSSFLHKATSRGFHIACERGDLKWNEAENILKVTSEYETLAYTDNVSDMTTMFKSQASEFLFDWSADKTSRALESAYCSLSVAEGAQNSIVSGLPASLVQLGNSYVQV
jgi:predicted dehydrogenase